MTLSTLTAGVNVAHAATAKERGDPTTAESADATEFFGKLVHRYRGLTLYQDSVRLAHRTTAESRDAGSRSEQILATLISGSVLDVSSSSVGAGASCDTRDASPVSRLALARQLWTLPHLALRFADEPLRSMHGGDDCGSLVPKRVESVTINERQFLRLHLESQRAANATADARCDETTVDFFVNPDSMLVERVEQSHELGEGMRYEATLEIVPSRALEEATPADQPKPAVAPAATPEPAPTAAPTTPTLVPAAAPASPAPAATPVAPQPPAVDAKRGPLSGPSVGCEPG